LYDVEARGGPPDIGGPRDWTHDESSNASCRPRQTSIPLNPAEFQHFHSDRKCLMRPLEKMRHVIARLLGLLLVSIACAAAQPYDYEKAKQFWSFQPVK